MREDMPNQDTLLAVLAERRPVGGDRVPRSSRPRSICCQSATEANGFVPEKRGKSVSEQTGVAALGIGKAPHEVEDQSTAEVDRKRRAREEA